MDIYHKDGKPRSGAGNLRAVFIKTQSNLSGSWFDFDLERGRHDPITIYINKANVELAPRTMPKKEAISGWNQEAGCYQQQEKAKSHQWLLQQTDHSPLSCYPPPCPCQSPALFSKYLSHYSVPGTAQDRRAPGEYGGLYLKPFPLRL